MKQTLLLAAGDDTLFMLLAGIVGFIIAVFLTRWIFRIDKIVSQQERIITLLEAVQEQVAPSAVYDNRFAQNKRYAAMDDLHARYKAGEMTEYEYEQAKHNLK